MGALMHCGAEPISYPALMGLPVPEPTETHYPIAHHQLFEVARDQLIDQGYSISNPTHYINREGAHYFSLMGIQHPDDEVADGHGTLCALRNSWDKTFRASFAIGARVFVCDNLSFSGDIVVGRKNTLNAWTDLPEILSGAVSKIRVMRKRQEIRFAEYKEAPLSDRVVDHLIMETYRQGIINLKRIGKVNDEWHNPSADHGDKSVWRYFNAVTAALGGASTAQLIQLPKKTIDLHLLLDGYCHLDFTDELDGTTVEGEATLLHAGDADPVVERQSFLRRVLGRTTVN